MEMSPFRTQCEEVESSLWFNFSEDKYKALPWGKHNPGVQHKLGFTRLGNSSVERGPGVLVDNQLNRSEQCTAVAKKDQRILGSIKNASPAEIKVTIPLYSVFVRPPLEYCVPFWSLLYRKKRCRQARQGSEKGQKDDQKLGILPCEERLRPGFVQPGEALITMFKCLKCSYKKRWRLLFHKDSHRKDGR